MTALHSRAVSVVTAASCVVHLWLVAENQHGPWLGVVMLAMVGVCLPCAVHLWRGGREKTLRQVMGCALAMAALHAVLLLGAPALSGSGGLGHSHAGAAAPGAGFFGTGSLGSGFLGPGADGLLAVVVLEITTAFLAATLLARLRSVHAEIKH
ncbi:hypothetical protein [Arthrobacter globiformis]|uniref:hypothetical protein n=1 Tax=Arthrobacter globiformis TaxID=1665 RepID=UPI00278B90E4|nr:hypothetical protein [Arthrobacter globiformis]MDQ0863069.1 hypothetical protein [Arthrobacter globiformis]